MPAVPDCGAGYSEQKCPRRDMTRLRQGRCRLGRRAVMRRPLIRITQLEQGRLAVRPAEEGYADGQIVGGEPRWHRHRGSLDQESVPGRPALVSRVRWTVPILVRRRLLF